MLPCVKTEHLVRVPQTHIFLMLLTCETSSTHTRGLKCLECLSLRAHLKSLVRLMFRRTLLDVPDPFLSFPSTPPHTQPPLLQAGTGMNTCAHPHG